MEELEKKAYIFGSLFTLANKLQVLGDAFDRNITIKQWLFLVGVTKFPEPPTVSEVAHFIGYSRQNAKRLAEALEERGYVTIGKDPGDARALRIAVTPACEAYFAGRSRREYAFIEELFEGFDGALLDGFCAGLQKLGGNIEAMMQKEQFGEKEE